MLASIYSAAVYGIDGYMVEVEVDIANGLPVFDIVGLPDTAVRESKDRVRSAIKNSNYVFPIKRITINLAPAYIKKEGPGFDLPIAIGILVATGQIRCKLRESLILGELSLNGRIRAVKGALPMAITGKQHHRTNIVVPDDNFQEVSMVSDIKIHGVSSLRSAAKIVGEQNQNRGIMIMNDKVPDCTDSYDEDFSDVIGQESARRALEVAAAGGHNLLMTGPPGTGKTMLARRLPTILPCITMEEALDVTKIYSIAGLLKDNNPLITARPFRSPHHTITKTGLVGGGKIPIPGEISLAHHGVLYLDELPEFRGDLLNTLRQPVEDGYIIISRITGSIKFPARFMLVASKNPCPCGYYADESKECICSMSEIRRYQQRITGPLLDRMDIFVDVPRMNQKQLMDAPMGERSEEIKARVQKARNKQRRRFNETKIYCNSHMGTREIQKYCQVEGESRRMLESIFAKFPLSARSYARILKLTRTIADLDECDSIKSYHISEAFQYRLSHKNI